MGVNVLLSAEEISARVQALGRKIAEEHAGRELVLVVVLKGSFVFAADLCRAIELPLRVEFLGMRSYAGTQSSGVVEITHDLKHPIEGADVLVVEDIVDTGLTMRYLLENLRTRKPRSVQLCALLQKPARAKVEVPIDYLGFTIEDRFVVGYGLDFDEKHRNLPYVGILES
jgi:hypoxanthine phosphoribosyltransferase